MIIKVLVNISDSPITTLTEWNAKLQANNIWELQVHVISYIWHNDASAHWRIYAPQGFILNMKTVFPGMGNSFKKIGRSWDRHIFIMGIPIPVRRNLYIETGPRILLWVRSIEHYLKRPITFSNASMEIHNLHRNWNGIIWALENRKLYVWLNFHIICGTYMRAISCFVWIIIYTPSISWQRFRVTYCQSCKISIILDFELCAHKRWTAYSDQYVTCNDIVYECKTKTKHAIDLK